jgi:hypothetical protein
VYTARVPGSASSVADAAAPVPSAARPSTGELVQRPDPGLARGVWEAQPSTLYVLGSLLVVAIALYGAARLGLLRWRRKAHERR